MTRQTVLVVGASGTVGSDIVKLLAVQGYKVCITTSKKVDGQSQHNVERAQANLVTGEGISKAFEGVDRVFLMSPAGYADQYKMLSPLIQEAKRRGLKKVVLMTAMGANAADTPFRRAEIELEKSGLAYNIIRPNWFMQNFNTFWVHGVREQGKIQLPAGSAKVSFIDARDISAVAAKLLTSDDLNNRDFDLTGPQAINHSEVAKEISVSSGKKTVYEEIEPATLKKGLVAAGLPEDYVDFLIMIFGFLRDGYNAAVTDGVERVLGRAPIEFKKYAKDYKQAWA